MTGNDLPLDAPAGAQNLVSVQTDLTVLGLREKKIQIVRAWRSNQSNRAFVPYFTPPSIFTTPRNT